MTVVRLVISLMSRVAPFLASFMLAYAGDQSSSEEIPPERRAYQVRLMVALDARSFDLPASRNILRDLDLTARRTVGDLWELKINSADWLNPVSLAGLQRLDRFQIANQYPGETADLWFAATVENLQVGLRISVRSWQPEVQSETSIVSAEVVDKRDIATSLIRLCRDLARPMGLVEQVTDKTVRIRLRAGEIVSPDPSFVQLKKGDILLPSLAFRGKQGVVERLQTIPWTYITVDDVDGSTVQGTVQSGIKVALGGKKRGRIDTVVVGLRPQHASTRIELMTQSKPQRPLVAHRIEVRSEPVFPKSADGKAQVDGNPTLISELLTDRRGESTVLAVQGQPLVWMFAFSGQNLLARVPFVPGISKEISLEVPDDATRLAAEADLQMLQSEVIDAVALRNTAIATIRAAAKKDDWVTVKQKLDLIKRQQNAGLFNDRLTAVRVAGIAASKARKDRTAETRINRMCDELKTLIAAHLSDDKVAEISEEMDAFQGAEKLREQKSQETP